MRKIFVLTLLVTFTLINLSCSNDEGETLNASESEITGTWNLTALETKDGRSDTNLDGTSIPTTFTAVGKDFNTVVTFSKDPNIVTSEGSYTTVTTTTVMGETSTEEETGEDFFESDAWRLDGSTLYFGTGDEEVGFTITELTDNKMSLRYTIDETVDFFGATTSVSATYNMTLTK
ncbi:hypothetical protein SAMN04488009_3486 [Maribacter sedimenticola]|uniref:Lipocalin-like domain-containing protein n=1 Tax=Maribacter sedimenticola TaxID=228956 RepID=A0ABY1SL21_9FLAO|nr:hypothetical protein [Maribacter sedimenticola]SNR73282.1 hypothetical protein SAMN04488009_3486 [Maribacter sedimenticola]